eukprot:6470628-Amphidinium_carterae.2
MFWATSNSGFLCTFLGPKAISADAAASHDFWGACSVDAASVCPTVSDGNGQMHECLMRNYMKLSAECRAKDVANHQNTLHPTRS